MVARSARPIGREGRAGAARSSTACRRTRSDARQRALRGHQPAASRAPRPCGDGGRYPRPRVLPAARHGRMAGAGAVHYFVNGGGGAYQSFGTALAWPAQPPTPVWAFYPTRGDVVGKIDQWTPIWKRPAWWWTRRFGAWPFSAEGLSAAFDYNVAPFFQSFIEVRVEPADGRLRLRPWGVHGRLRWSDLRDVAESEARRSVTRMTLSSGSWTPALQMTSFSMIYQRVRLVTLANRSETVEPPTAYWAVKLPGADVRPSHHASKHLHSVVSVTRDDRGRPRAAAACRSAGLRARWHSGRDHATHRGRGRRERSHTLPPLRLEGRVDRRGTDVGRDPGTLEIAARRAGRSRP